MLYLFGLLLLVFFTLPLLANLRDPFLVGYRIDVERLVEGFKMLVTMVAMLSFVGLGIFLLIGAVEYVSSLLIEVI